MVCVDLIWTIDDSCVDIAFPWLKINNVASSQTKCLKLVFLCRADWTESSLIVCKNCVCVFYFFFGGGGGSRKCMLVIIQTFYFCYKW